MIDNDFEFRRGYHFGIAEERERILALITDELINCECENPWQHAQASIKSEKAQEPRVSVDYRQVPFTDKGEK